MEQTWTFTAASAGSLAAFVAILLAVCSAAIWGVQRATEKGFRFAIGLVICLGIFSAVVASGKVEASPVPRLLILMLGTMLAGVALAFSPLGKKLSEKTPVWALVGFQAFRLPLECVLHAWAAQGTVPVSMTWDGANLDWLSGALALVSAPLCRQQQGAAWLANSVGFVLLLNVMRTAILSSPLPFAWPVDPPLLLAFHLPYALIVPVCVAGALAGHLILTRALLSRSA